MARTKAQEKFWNDFIKIIKAKNGKLLSCKKDYLNKRSKLLIECLVCENKWSPLMDNVVHKSSWCPKCATSNQKYKNGDLWEKLEGVIKQKKGVLHSTKIDYINKNSVVKVECENKHVWKKSIGEIASGNWCKKCAVKKASTQRKIKANVFNRAAQILKNKNCSILTDEARYKNIYSPLKIKCHSCNFQGMTTANAILNNISCPECGSGRGERFLRAFLNEVYKTEFIKTRGEEWNINPYTGKRLELDCYNEELKIAVEYDGSQHIKASVLFGGVEKLMDTVLRDAIKEDNCIENGIKLYRVKEPPKSTMRWCDLMMKHIVDELKEQGLDLNISDVNRKRMHQIYTSI